MAAQFSSSWSRQMARTYWLPPGGIGNGLGAQAWAPLADADAGPAVLLPDALRDADIAAYAARLDPPGKRRPGGGRRGSSLRLWVDTHARAEDAVRPLLLRYRPHGQ
jgi:hypothetical protein